MGEVKVAGGKVYTRTRDEGHSCATPEARKFDPGDVFECGACGKHFTLIDAQAYVGGPFWQVSPKKRSRR